MKALWRYENGVQDFREIDEPKVQAPDDIKIKVMYSTIGIQDLRMYREWDFYAKPGVAGYEMSGIIVDLGEEAIKEGFYKGQKVTGTVAKFCGGCIYCIRGEENNCLQIHVSNGTICEYIVWKSKQVIPLKNTTPFSLGCLVEPVAVVHMAAKKLYLTKKDSICVFGGDFNGLLMIQFARLYGVKEITVVETKKASRELAYQFGANHVIDPLEDTYETELMKISDFIGFQTVVVTSSHPDWIQTAMNIVARGGTIMFTVYFDLSKDISINSIKFFAMNINITSSFLYTDEVLKMTSEIMDSLQLKELISKEFSAKDVLQAFEVEQTHRYPRIGLIMNL